MGFALQTISHGAYTASEVSVYQRIQVSRTYWFTQVPICLESSLLASGRLSRYFISGLDAKGPSSILSAPASLNEGRAEVPHEPADDLSLVWLSGRFRPGHPGTHSRTLWVRPSS